MLAALLSIYDANAIFDGTAILYITGTGLTTYIAHVISEMQEYRVLHGGTRRENSSSARWATQAPILGTTVYPVLLLILAAILPPAPPTTSFFDCTILLCLATVVWRIFSLNFTIARYRGEPSAGVPSEALWLTLAVIVLAIVKIMFTTLVNNLKAPLTLRLTEIREAFVSPSQDAPGLSQSSATRQPRTSACRKAKGKKKTRDTSDIAHLRMRRMHRAFISTLSGLAP